MTKGLGITSILAAVVAMASCTVQQQEIPGLTGPSELALSVTMTATPDSISQDGASQSAIIITARDANAGAVSGLPFRVNIFAGDVPVDFGTLSGRTVVTGSDGRATVVYTAPAAFPNGSPSLGECVGAPFGAGVLPGPCVQIVATPIGSNFQAAPSHGVTVHLVPVGVILPPAQTPKAAFTISPSSAVPGQDVLFDASASCPGSDPCSSPAGITSFVWSFGDGSSGSGRTLTHEFDRAGTYAVTLTVTNDRGIQASTTQTITIGASAPPAGSIVVSPSAITAGDDVFFTITNLVPGNGRTIVSITWNFGDGTPTATGQSVTHQFGPPSTFPNTFTVLVTIVDDLGQTTTLSRAVQVDP